MSKSIGSYNETRRKSWISSVLKTIPNDSRILDAGAGELANKKYCSHLNYVSQDLCQYEGTGDNKGLQTGIWNTQKIDLVCDISDIPEGDKSFDAILCSEVLEHLPDPLLALKEFHRLLKHDGELILTAPFCSLTHFAPYHYSTGFNRYFYEYNLDKLGFEITEITTNGNYFEYLAQEVKRIPSVAEQYSKKKISLFEKLGLNFILKVLARLARADKGSNELLCFGYHIKAKKR